MFTGRTFTTGCCISDLPPQIHMAFGKEEQPMQWQGKLAHHPFRPWLIRVSGPWAKYFTYIGTLPSQKISTWGKSCQALNPTAQNCTREVQGDGDGCTFLVAPRAARGHLGSARDPNPHQNLAHITSSNIQSQTTGPLGHCRL
jgi:hypothetical protein